MIMICLVLLIAFPSCFGGNLNGTLYSTRNIMYGVQDWSTLPGGVLSGQAVIVDCVSFQCSSSGRRMSHNFGPFSNAPISYPDPTLTASDPCDMSTVIRPALASGKIAVVAYPWQGNCVFGTFTIKAHAERYLTFISHGFIGLGVLTTVVNSFLTCFYALVVAVPGDSNVVPDFPIAHFALDVTETIQKIDAGFTLTLDDSQPNLIVANLGDVFFPLKDIVAKIAVRVASCVIALYYFFKLFKGLTLQRLRSQIGGLFVVLMCLLANCFGLYVHSFGPPKSFHRSTPPYVVVFYQGEIPFMIGSDFVILACWIRVLVNRRFSALQSAVLDLAFVVIGIVLMTVDIRMLAGYGFSFNDKDQTGSGYAGQNNGAFNEFIRFQLRICIASAVVFGVGALWLLVRIAQLLRLKQTKDKKLIMVLGNTLCATAGIIVSNALLAERMQEILDGLPSYVYLSNYTTADTFFKLYMVTTSLASSSSSSSSSC